MAIEGPEGREWKAAAEREWKNLLDHGVYEWVQPKNEKVISCGTVLKEKMADGILTERKVRAVAHGYRQVEGIHYTETFAAVMRLESLRTMLASWDDEGARPYASPCRISSAGGEARPGLAAFAPSVRHEAGRPRMA